MNKTTIYVIFVVTSLIFPPIEFWITGEVQPFGPYSIVEGLLVAILALWWLRLDAAEGYPSKPLMKGLTVLLAPLALAIHLFRTRGWKKGARANATMLGLILVAMVAESTGEWIAGIP